jgi:hypothetical protein
MKVYFQQTQDVQDVHKLAKAFGEDQVTLQDVKPEEMRTLLQQAGNKIGSVHFKKRKTGVLRKMCYRLHVKNPSAASKPKGTNRKNINVNNQQMTVFDVNKVLRNRQGEILFNDEGKQQRGAWRTVPLENVVRACIDGVTYVVEA